MGDDAPDDLEAIGAELPPDQAHAAANGLEESLTDLEYAFGCAVSELRSDPPILTVATSTQMDRAVGQFAGAQKTLKRVFMSEYADVEVGPTEFVREELDRLYDDHSEAFVEWAEGRDDIDLEVA